MGGTGGKCCPLHNSVLLCTLEQRSGLLAEFAPQAVGLAKWGAAGARASPQACVSSRASCAVPGLALRSAPQ